MQHHGKIVTHFLCALFISSCIRTPQRNDWRSVVSLCSFYCCVLGCRLCTWPTYAEGRPNFLSGIQIYFKNVKSSLSWGGEVTPNSEPLTLHSTVFAYVHRCFSIGWGRPSHCHSSLPLKHYSWTLEEHRAILFFYSRDVMGPSSLPHHLNRFCPLFFLSSGNIACARTFHLVPHRATSSRANNQIRPQLTCLLLCFQSPVLVHFYTKASK